ncbi:hypothetical protein ACFROC_18085 [Nocardia tengchongensis]|uniref:hypothetical protein n=1 Tax=Nocardia tengchongensis TaxID=2055889 RepID=UPI0036C83DAF
MSTDPDFGPDLATGEAQPKPRPRAVGLPPMAAMLSRRMASESAVPAETSQAADEADQAAAGDFDAEYNDEIDGDAGDFDAEYDSDDYDDQDDYDPDTDADPAYTPEGPAADPDASGRRGSWVSWLPEDGRPAARPEVAEDDSDEFDEFDDETDEFDLPDYDVLNAAGRQNYTDVARAAFTDRSGGRGAAVRARLKRRRDTDAGGGREVYRARSGTLAVLAVVGVVAVVTVVIVVNVRGSSPLLAPAAPTHPSGTGSPAPAAVTAPATTETYPHATADCYATKSPDTVVGAGPGDPSTGPGVILGFEWAYYSDRSGARARDWVAADAAVPDAATIQAGIDTVPVATRYCVHVSRADSDASGGTWNVVLSEQFPTDRTPQQWAQTITTRSQGGRVLITSIRKAD